MDPKEFFEGIYDNNSWSDAQSRSGTGSNLEQTKKIRILIPSIIKKYRIRSLLDIPCGDFFWMKELVPQLRTLIKTYIGGDIVNKLIFLNNEYYSDTKFKFNYLDLLKSLLPASDLIFCRDLLVHLSYKDILKALINIKKSNSKYLLTTTFPGRTNRDIMSGAWRPLDLQKFPFMFPRPLEIFSEDCTEFEGRYSDKSLALWEIRRIGLVRFMVFESLITIYRKLKLPG